MCDYLESVEASDATRQSIQAASELSPQVQVFNRLIDQMKD